MTTVNAPANEETPTTGGIFAGIRFFLVQRLPSRSDYVARIQANGGRVVKIEAQADHIVADHLRNDCPPGSISFTFVDTALTEGVLPDPNDHQAGAPPSTLRPVGYSAPGKATRTPFTAEDDRVLWEWVEPARLRSESVKGNELYKDLEMKNSRHTWQAWRDRYVKKLIDKPPAGVKSSRNPETGFAEEHRSGLLHRAKHFEPIHQDQLEEACITSAESRANDHHEECAATVSQSLHGNIVRPVHFETQVETESSKTSKRKANDQNSNDETPQVNGDASQAEKDREEDDPSARPSKMRRTSPRESESSQPILTEREIPVSPIVVSEHHIEVGGDSQQRVEDAEEREAVHLPNDHVQDPIGASGTHTHPICLDEDDGGRVEADNSDTAPMHRNKLRSANDLRRKRGSDRNVDVDDSETLKLQMSDANKPGDQQVLHQSWSSDSSKKLRRNPSITTLDANSCADQQVRRESLGVFDEMDSMAAPKHVKSVDGLPIHGHSDRQSFYDDESNDDRFIVLVDARDVSRGRDMLIEGTEIAIEPSPCQPLTEANLVSQQAGHRRKQTRALDLLEDEEEQDQTQFAQYLQHLTGIHQQDQHEESHHQSSKFSDIIRCVKKDDFVPSGGAVKSMAPGVPTSSQAEVDEAIEANITWPSSHQTSPRETHSQTALFETQFEHPEPSADIATFPSLPDEIRMVDAPSRAQQNKETVQLELSSPPVEDYAALDEAGAEAEALDNPVAQHDSFVFIDRNDFVKSKDGSTGNQDDHVDLSIPEPDGGWEVAPSPHEIEAELQSRAEWPTDVMELNIFQNHGDAENVDHHAMHETVELLSSDSSNSPFESADEATSEKQRITQIGNALDTQSILNAETQQPDLSIPLPPDSDEEEGLFDRHKLSRPPPAEEFAASAIESQSQQRVDLANTQTLDKDEDIDSYITTLVVRKGYKETSIINALKSSSMRPELAEIVLLEEGAGRGFPTDVRGIWTEQEDTIIEGTDPTKLAMIEDKHGWDEIQARQRFLQEWREG